MLVTGASSGIGEAACEGLPPPAPACTCSSGMRTGRRAPSPGSSRDCRRHADGSSSSSATSPNITSVRRFAESFQARCERLDVLVNNAGVLPPAARRHNSDGVELTFATNVLGPFLLTSLLLPALLAGRRRRG